MVLSHSLILAHSPSWYFLNTNVDFKNGPYPCISLPLGLDVVGQAFGTGSTAKGAGGQNFVSNANHLMHNDNGFSLETSELIMSQVEECWPPFLAPSHSPAPQLAQKQQETQRLPESRKRWRSG
jgi:hypothetical protein